MNIITHQWKNLLKDFMTGLPFSINWKKDSCKSNLVSINWITKIVHYKPVKITTNVPGLAKVIIDVIMRYHVLSDWIVTNWSFFFPSNSGHCSAISSASSIGFSSLYIYKLTAKSKDRKVLLKQISKPLSISSRMIRLGSY